MMWTAWLLASLLGPVTTAANQVAVNASDAISNLPDSEPYDPTSAISAYGTAGSGFGPPVGFGPASGSSGGGSTGHGLAGRDPADRKDKTIQDKPENDKRGQDQKGNIRGTISMKKKSLQSSQKETDGVSGGEPARHTEQAAQDPADTKDKTTLDKPENDQKLARKKGQEDDVQRSPETSKKTQSTAKKGIAIQAGAVEPQPKGMEFAVAFMAAVFISATAITAIISRRSRAEEEILPGYVLLDDNAGGPVKGEIRITD